MRALQVNIPEKTHQKLDKLKEEKGLSKSEIARRGIVDQMQELGVEQ